MTSAAITSPTQGNGGEDIVENAWTSLKQPFNLWFSKPSLILDLTSSFFTTTLTLSTMHCKYSLLAFAAVAATALALPTGKPFDTDKQVPAWYEGKGDNFGDGQYVPEEYEKKKDEGSWHPGKYEGKGTGHDDGKWTPTKYPGEKSKAKRNKVGTIDDESRKPTKYETKGANFEDAKLASEKFGKRSDDGTWRPGKYEGDCTDYDDGKWNPKKHD
ncbi:hypothetical protein FACUT_6560 [Fusarium acutatum]|uniref:Uncharacterized protein n=1 Tax=Fusarium acutatum TaxID=78861 RepID=A0A8H4JSH8_9HYPO|nr:hypothetical protein FACUT_6560 [Fusarium acutatum]